MACFKKTNGQTTLRVYTLNKEETIEGGEAGEGGGVRRGGGRGGERGAETK